MPSITTTLARTSVRILVGAVLLSAVAGTASAQQPAAPDGTMIVEQIHSGWLFAPDVRAADLGGEAGALAGGYIGRITDRRWVFGAGGYFLTNREDDFKMIYGGPVFEWLFRSDRKIGFGVRALVGAGTATMPVPLEEVIDPRVLAAASQPLRRVRATFGLFPADATIAVDDEFFIAEPQANVTWNITPGQRLVFGLGYRAVGGAGYIADDVRGVSGSIAFQIGGK